MSEEDEATLVAMLPNGANPYGYREEVEGIHALRCPCEKAQASQGAECRQFNAIWTFGVEKLAALASADALLAECEKALFVLEDGYGWQWNHGIREDIAALLAKLKERKG